MIRRIGVAPSVDISRPSGPWEAVLLVVDGAIPSKKNKLRPHGDGRGQGYDKRTRGELKALIDQVMIQWGPRRPIEHPDMNFAFLVYRDSQDRDGMQTTMLDVLKKAGVIVDDSIKCFNGAMRVDPAQMVKHPSERRAYITVTYPKGAADARGTRNRAR